MANRAPPGVLFALLFTAAPAVAQFTPWGGSEPSPCLPFVPENSIAWPTGTGFGDAQDFGRLVLAELNGDHAPEAIVVAGGVPVVLWKVALYDVPEAIVFPSAPPPTAVTDIAVLTGLQPNGTDALAMSDARGLFLVTYGGEAFPNPTVIAEGWTNAFKLHAEDVDGDGDQDILGVSASRRSILTCLKEEDIWEPQPPITLQLDILDVTLVNWDGDPFGTQELVALTKRALVVFLPSGQFLMPYLSSTGCIARFRAQDVAGGERLAWTRRISPGSSASQLVIVGQGGVLEGPWPLEFDWCEGPLTPIEPVALLAGNYDGNANDELLLVHETNHTAIVLANLADPSDPVPEHFAPSDPGAFDIIALASDPLGASNLGIPAFADVDSEAPDDLVFPVSSTETVEVFLSLPYLRTGLVGNHYNSADITAQQTEYGPWTVGPRGELRFAFFIPTRYQDYTHLDMIVWRQRGEGMATDPDAVYYTRRPLAFPAGSNDSYDHQWIEVRPTIPGFPLGFPDNMCWTDTVGDPKPYFFTEFRFVKNGTTFSRIFAGGFSLVTCGDGPGQGQETDFWHLVSQGILDSAFPLLEHNGLTQDDGSPARTFVGSYVPMDGVPYFDEGESPDAGPRTDVTEPAHFYDL